MVRLDLDIDDILRGYLSGETIRAIANRVGCDPSVISFRLQEAGARERGTNIWNMSLDDGEIVRLYNSGMSVKALAAKFGVSRNVIDRRLKRANIIPRGRSESMFVRMSQTSPEERMRLTAFAHDAKRGVPEPFDRRCQIAATRERTLSGSTPAEVDFCNSLIDRGFKCILQKAVGSYNIDIAIIEPPIAVEIFGGGWHHSGRHAARYRKRIEYLIDCGYTPIIIWVGKNWPLGIGAIEYIIALSQKLSSGEADGREEHVIRGDGYLCSVGDRKFNCFPGKRLTYHRDTTTGRYTSSAWE